MGRPRKICEWSGIEVPAGTPKLGDYAQCPAHPQAGVGYVLVCRDGTFIAHEIREPEKKKRIRRKVVK